MTESTFEFKGGTVVTLLRVNPVFVGKVAAGAEEAYTADNEVPACPTYEVKVAGGGAEVQDLTPETIELDPWKDDEELQEKWEAYQSAQEAIAGERIRATAKAYCVKGIKEDTPEKWIEDQAYWGVSLPEDRRDIKWDWVRECAQNDWGELVELVFAIQSLPDPTEVAARAAEDSFRDSVGSPDGGEDASGDSGPSEEGETE